MDPNGIQLAKDPASMIVFSPKIGTNGKTFLVNWSKKSKDTWPGGMSGKIYDLNGNCRSTVLNIETGTWAYVGSKRQGSFHPEPQLDIVSNGTDFAFLLRAVRQTRYLATYALPFFRVKPDGVIVNQKHPLDIDKNMHAFSAGAVSIGSSGYAVVWEGLPAGTDERNSNRNVYMAKVNGDMTENTDYDTPIAVADTEAAELCPDIAVGCTELLVVYEEDNLKDYPLTRDILKARIVILP
jgi:hypothetical protein